MNTFKGMSDEMLRWQTGKLQELEVARDDWTVDVRPELVVEIAFDGVQRSPRYLPSIALRFARVKRSMTRAVTVAAPPEIVWPWLAQLGRGAGWYSYDRLDNGGKTSARHILSWVPTLREGDATAIGYLRHVTPGSELTWWVPGSRSLGSTARTAVDIRLSPEEGGSRLVIRMSGDATGGLPGTVIWIFRFIDSIMARRQLLGIKERAERHGARASDPERPETGARDQYQLYEVIYASGERAGAAGKELAERWHRAAVAAG